MLLLYKYVFRILKIILPEHKRNKGWMIRNHKNKLHLLQNSGSGGKGLCSFFNKKFLFHTKFLVYIRKYSKLTHNFSLPSCKKSYVGFARSEL